MKLTLFFFLELIVIILGDSWITRTHSAFRLVTSVDHWLVHAFFMYMVTPITPLIIPTLTI